MAGSCAPSVIRLRKFAILTNSAVNVGQLSQNKAPAAAKGGAGKGASKSDKK